MAENTQTGIRLLRAEKLETETDYLFPFRKSAGK